MSAGQGWSYTSVFGPTPGVDVGRSGRRLVTFCGALANEQAGAELLEKHLARCALIAQIGGFAWQAPLSAEEVVHLEQDYATAVREFGKRHSPLSYLIWNWRAERKYSSEWLGELSGKLPPP